MMRKTEPTSRASLTVIYDGECELCRRSRRWMERQSALTELRFVPLQSTDVRDRFPQLEGLDLHAELVTVDDAGRIYRGADAWLKCLGALEKYRGLADRFSAPAFAPIAGRLYRLIARNRLGLSRRLFKASPDELIALMEESSSTCPVKGACNG